jgi:hypothetical protein
MHDSVGHSSAPVPVVSRGSVSITFLGSDVDEDASTGGPRGRAGTAETGAATTMGVLSDAHADHVRHSQSGMPTPVLVKKGAGTFEAKFVDNFF